MITQSIKILFVISATRINKKGLVPLVCRITYLSKRKPFATGLFINPNHWNNATQQAIPIDIEHTQINSKLSLIRNKINQAFLFLQINNSEFSLEDIINQYNGVPIKKDFCLLEVYSLYLIRIEKLIDKDIKLVTFKKYQESKKHLADFVKWKFKTTDIKLKDIKSNFVVEYEYFLKVEKNLQLSTLNKAIQRFRKVLNFAISQNYLDKDPFILYKAKRIKKEIVFLDSNELDKLENYNFEIKRVQQIKDLFIFCCYTGLGFLEMVNLKTLDIVKGFDGELWIDIKRNKTQKSYKVPLLPKAKEIIEFYHNNEDDFVFPRISNTKFNAYLKEVAGIIGIEKNLTHHIARKTFATTVLLFNDVPMEIVSELLGHSKISTTQDHYAKVVQKKVSEQIINLTKKIK